MIGHFFIVSMSELYFYVISIKILTMILCLQLLTPRRFHGLVEIKAGRITKILTNISLVNPYVEQAFLTH